VSSVKEDRVDPKEQQALSILCDELPTLLPEVRLHTPDRMRLLERIIAEAAARRPVLALLSELLGTTGIDETRQALGAGLPGTGPGRADDERFECPDGACPRTATTIPAGPAPTCSVTGHTMRRR
jgi:hypothetical protein